MGLQDNVPDFRLCCWTFIPNPFIRFIYWQMNYHTEHHMYAAVPCYNLRKLHEAIKHDLPPSPVGIRSAWEEIIAILRKQKADSAYRFVPALPARSGVLMRRTDECAGKVVLVVRLTPYLASATIQVRT